LEPFQYLLSTFVDRREVLDEAIDVECRNERVSISSHKELEVKLWVFLLELQKVVRNKQIPQNPG
jgi:hypothetical protein